ncbi:MAG: hypothetical protein ACJAVR_004059, partial [Paracoccaceae bacterium]
MPLSTLRMPASPFDHDDDKLREECGLFGT